MADLRLTSNANTNNQPLYTSVKYPYRYPSRQGSQDYVYSSTTGNQPPIKYISHYAVDWARRNTPTPTQAFRATSTHPSLTRASNPE